MEKQKKSRVLFLHLTAVCGAAELGCSDGFANEQAATLLQVSLNVAVGQQEPERDATTTREFCVKGSQLPQFFLLGFQKAASSTLADTLMKNANITPALRPRPPYANQYHLRCWDEGVACSWKEFHFWDSWLPEKNLLDCAKKALSDMQAHLPSCNPAAAGSLVADLTPLSVGLVPLPQGNLMTGEHYGHATFVTNKTDTSLNLPAALLASYGSYLARRLTFAVAIREPLARMHSAYYHAFAESYAVCSDCLQADSFKSSLLLSMAEAEKSPPIYQDWLYIGLAGYQLQHWIKHMAADQFVIVPFRQSLTNLGAACREITTRLGMSSSCKSQMDNHVNAHPHPKLQDEGLTSEDFRRFEAIVEPDVQLLSRLLEEMHNNGASVVGYTANASRSSFRSWLEENW